MSDLLGQMIILLMLQGILMIYRYVEDILKPMVRICNEIACILCRKNWLFKNKSLFFLIIPSLVTPGLRLVTMVTKE